MDEIVRALLFIEAVKKTEPEDHQRGSGQGLTLMSAASETRQRVEVSTLGKLSDVFWVMNRLKSTDRRQAIEYFLQTVVTLLERRQPSRFVLFWN